jgi:hypothetical protein
MLNGEKWEAREEKQTEFSLPYLPFLPVNYFDCEFLK